MNKTILAQNSDIFSCPVCLTDMAVNNNSLLCETNHCFDIAKSGYINFVSRPVQTDYDKKLWESRRAVNESSVFDGLMDSIKDIILEHSNKSSGYILDAGCGEGSHLSYLLDQGDLPYLGFGIDLSKDGIMMASKKHKKHFWCVGDLTKTPFKSGFFDIIMNILSPANYSEFSRLLGKNGTVIKVIPNSNYLAELRKIFYEGHEKEIYSNKDTIDIFKKNFNLVDIKETSYMYPVNAALLDDIIKMSPISWNVDEMKTRSALDAGICNITIDFSILVGKKK